MRLSRVLLIFLLSFCTTYASDIEYYNNYFGSLYFSSLDKGGYVARAYKSEYITNELDIRQMLFGAQSVVFIDDFELRAQATARKNDNSLTPYITWLNAKYNINNNLAIRVGRMQVPIFLNSNSIDISYVHTWAKEPMEIYSMVPTTYYDAVELMYSKDFGRYYVESLVTLYGEAVEDMFIKGLEEDTTEELIYDSLYGMTLSVERGYFAYKGAFYKTKISLNTDKSLKTLYEAIKTLGYESLIDEKYRLVNKDAYFGSLGIEYDDGEYIFKSELSIQKVGKLLPDMMGYYLSLGYRYGKFTPYISFSEHKNNEDYYYENSLISPYPNAQPLYDMVADQIEQALYLSNYSQKSLSIGLRYDYIDGIAFKAQLDRITTTEYGVENTTSEYARVGYLFREQGVEKEPVYQFTFGVSFAF
jgi:hypothetical protein